MDLNKLTTKSQEALRDSQELAIVKNQPQVDAFHLLYALINQENSSVPLVFKKLEINVEKIAQEIMTIIDSYPKNPKSSSNIAQIFITPEVIVILNGAQQEAKKIGDEYISTEHILLAFLSIKTPYKEFLEKRKDESLESA